MFDPTLYEARGWSEIEPVSYLDGTYGGSRAVPFPDWVPTPEQDPVSGTDELPLIGMMLGNNGPWPAYTSGAWGLFLDPEGHYMTYSGYPQTQNGSFKPLQHLALLSFSAGASYPVEVVRYYPAPVIWRRGGYILVDIGGVTSQGQAASVQAMWSPMVLLPKGSQLMNYLVTPPPSAPGVSVAWSKTLNADTNGNHSASFRVLTPNLAAGGNQIRFVFRASETGAFATIAAAFGVHTSGGAVSSLTPITFGGAQGFSVGPGVEIASDWISHSSTSGQNYIVAFDTASSGGNARYTTSGDGLWFKSPAASASQTAPSGFTQYANNTAGIMRVEVRTV